MGYLDERENDEAVKPLDLKALSKKAPKSVTLAPESLAVARERGFARDVGGNTPNVKGVEPSQSEKEAVEPPTPIKPSRPRLAVEEPKPAQRRQISRRRRNSGRDTGQLTLTGDAETLEALTFHAVYQRVPYVAMLGQMLELWEKTHGPLPPEFVAGQKDEG